MSLESEVKPAVGGVTYLPGDFLQRFFGVMQIDIGKLRASANEDLFKIIFPKLPYQRASLSLAETEILRQSADTAIMDEMAFYIFLDDPLLLMGFGIDRPGRNLGIWHATKKLKHDAGQQEDLPEGATEMDVHEPHVAELADGTLLGAIRVHREKSGKKANTFTTESTDGGKTWGEPIMIFQ